MWRMPKTHASMLTVVIVLLVFGGYRFFPVHVRPAGALLAAETQSAPATTQAGRPKTEAELAIEYRLMQERIERVVPVRMDLARKALTCATQPGPASKAKAMQAVEAVLAKEQPDAEMLFAAARVADLCEEPAKAIAILERIADKHPNERAPRIVAPAALMAHYQIGSIARHMGDFDRATAAYEEVLRRAGDDLEVGGVAFEAHLYLAEIAAEHRHDKDLALARLDGAGRIAESYRDPSNSAGPEWVAWWVDWLDYQRTAIRQGPAQARQQLRRTHPGVAILLAGMMLETGGMGQEDLEPGSYESMTALLTPALGRIIRDGRSTLDRDMALLSMGAIHDQHGDMVFPSDSEELTEAQKAEKIAESQKALAAAVPYYQALFQEESYFAPVAGLRLADVLKALGRTDEAEKVLEELKAKYPVYEPAVNEVRKSWQDKGREARRSYFPQIL
jgi:tetratricopeptide (TPR) repeat protein